jgi:hypothetical protein
MCALCASGSSLVAGVSRDTGILLVLIEKQRSMDWKGYPMIAFAEQCLISKS